MMLGSDFSHLFFFFLTTEMLFLTSVKNAVFNMKAALRGLLVKKCRYKLIERMMLAKKLIIM